MKPFLCRHQAHVTLLATKLKRLAWPTWHLCAEKRPFDIPLSVDVYESGWAGSWNKRTLDAPDRFMQPVRQGNRDKKFPRHSLSHRSSLKSNEFGNPLVRDSNQVHVVRIQGRVNRLSGPVLQYPMPTITNSVQITHYVPTHIAPWQCTNVVHLDEQNRSGQRRQNALCALQHT